MLDDLCSYEDEDGACHNERHCRGLCVAHYARAQREARGVRVRGGPIRPRLPFGRRVVSTLRLPEDLHHQLLALAKRRRVPLADIHEEALWAWAKRHGRRR